MIRLDNVSYTYPFQERPAVHNIFLDIHPGEVTLVTGRSGCGKSTLIRLINGLCPHSFEGTLSGEITIAGRSTKEMPLQEIAHAVGTVFQDPELQFFSLHVDDELAFAHEWLGKSPERIQNIVDDILQLMGIEHIRSSSLHDISEGQKQKVALGSVLSVEPNVVILDEPTANLDPESTAELAGHLARLAENGIAVLVVDHRLYWLEGVADNVVVMEEGRIASQGQYSMLRESALRERYGLRSAQVKDARKTLPDVCEIPTESGFVAVENLSFGHTEDKPLYTNASFHLPIGITGIIGENGAGKTTLARLLTGLTRLENGTLYIEGEIVAPKEVMPRASIVLQNTDHQLHMRTVLEEVITASGARSLKDIDVGPFMDLLVSFGLEHLSERHPQSLSGGEKQRLVIACGMAKNPDILILDEPTSGLDGGNMQRIAHCMRTAAKSGVCVLVISHDLELLSLACEYALRLPLKPSESAAIEKTNNEDELQYV